jgi:hypothetical protein
MEMHVVIRCKSTSTHRVVENVHIESVTGREKNQGNKSEKQVHARRHDRIDETQTPKEKKRKKGKKNNPQRD